VKNAKINYKPPASWPRVTEIIGDVVPDPGLERMKSHDPVSLEGYAENGKLYHSWAEKIAHGKFPGVTSPEFVALRSSDPEMADAVRELMVWFGANVEEVIFAEREVWSIAYGYRGTLDLIAKLNGTSGLVEIDHKRRKSVGRQGKLQTAGYSKASYEMGLIKGPVRRALLLNPRGVNKPSLEWIDSKGKSTLDTDTNAFLCAVTLYHWKKANQ